MPLLLLLALVRFQLPSDSLPPPRGFVNDFAGVIDPQAAARMDSTLLEVQQLTHGDIAVVTLSDIGNREAGDVALQIGRQWKLGGAGPIGDPSKNLGVVLLVVPLKNHEPGTGQVYIATGRGAEGFLNDARVGRIRDAMIPALRTEDYSTALETGVGLLAQSFANEFHVTLTTPIPTAAPQPVSGPKLPGPVVAFAVFLIIIIVVSSLARATRGGGLGALWWLSILSGMRGSGRGGWGGGGGGGSGGGFGGGGGGGFGGFGGGGGFSGGGAGGRF